MLEDGIVKQRQIGFDPETSMHCFGGGGGGGGGGGFAGENSTESRPANTYNFNQPKDKMDAIQEAAKTAFEQRAMQLGQVTNPYETQKALAEASPMSASLNPSQLTGIGGGFQAEIQNAIGGLGGLGGTSIASPQQDFGLNNVNFNSAQSPKDFMGNALTTVADVYNQARAGLDIAPGVNVSTGGINFGSPEGPYGQLSINPMDLERALQFKMNFAEGGAVPNSGIATLMRRRV